MIKNDEKMEICEELWIKYEPDVRRIANYKLMNHPQDAQEVVSATYLALCDAVEGGKEILNYKGYLYGIVDHIIKTTYEDIKRNKARQISLEAVKDQLTYEQDFDRESIDEDEIIRQANEILSQLTPSELTLYTLFYKKNYDYKKIGKIMGIKPNVAKQRKYRLDLKLQKIISKYKK